MSARTGIVTAALVGLAIALGGWFIGHGFYEGRAAERFVTVKGVAERDVEADVALWPLSILSTDDDLAKAQEQLEKSREKVLAFIEGHDIPRSAAEIQKFGVTDAYANQYQSGEVRSRYTVTETLMVRSSRPELIRNASQDIGTLVQSGVVLSGRYGPDSSPTYLFTRLNDVKPEMIAEATAAAREAAVQFARDSSSRLGGIRRANQGVFVILPRDQAPGINEEDQFHKTVRVVATLDFYLED